MHSELRQLITARNTLISVNSTDESVEFQAIMEVAKELGRNVQDWTQTSGIMVYSPEAREPAAVGGTDKPELALRYLLRNRRSSIAVMRGLAPFTTQPLYRRLLRDFELKADGERDCMILMDEVALHPLVQRLCTPWRPGLPDKDELEDLVKQTYRRLKKEALSEVATDLRKREFEQLILNLRGLTRSEAIRVVESVILDDLKLNQADITRVIEAKRRLLESSGSLESMTIDFDIDEVGGLRGLKSWLSERRGGFSEAARNYGIEPPRGVLMLGVPGCGKSLCAKAVAADWGIPLLRLDPGVLYQKFVGESENQLRQAIQQAEAMAPAILWIDEIEKAFASASSDSADGGLSQRMFGTLLSWMQDHREPIFIVATANDISALPPELMRKGRFDEVFFIDLPSLEARRQIFSVHLKRRNRNPANFDIEALGDASKDLTGAEIEQAVMSALFAAFSDGREIDTTDIITAIAKTNPLSSLMHEKIEYLRDWAMNRCVRAD